MSIPTRARAGFTLIELLVVVVIIGILATIATNGYLGAMDKARDSGMISNARTVQLGIENWKTDNSSLPTALVGQSPTKAGAGTPDNGALAPDSPSDAKNFPVPYLPGNKIPRGPWSNACQQTNGDWGNVSTADGTGCNAGSAEVIFTQGVAARLVPGTQFFADGDQTKEGVVSNTSPESRVNYGYIYFIGDLASTQYAVMGVGKGTGTESHHPWVVAVKSNF